jgi:hypothetical protein
MTKTPKKTTAKAAKPKRDDPKARVTVSKPGDRIVEDPVGGTTQSDEQTGRFRTEVEGPTERDYQDPPTHQPGVAVEPGLDPTTPPNAN